MEQYNVVFSTGVWLIWFWRDKSLYDKELISMARKREVAYSWKSQRGVGCYGKLSKKFNHQVFIWYMEETNRNAQILK